MENLGGLNVLWPASQFFNALQSDNNNNLILIVLGINDSESGPKHIYAREHICFGTL